MLSAKHLKDLIKEAIDRASWSLPEMKKIGPSTYECSNYPEVKWGSSESVSCTVSHSKKSDRVTVRLDQAGDDADLDAVIDLITQWSIDAGAAEIAIKGWHNLSKEQDAVLRERGFKLEAAPSKLDRHSRVTKSDWREQALVLIL